MESLPFKLKREGQKPIITPPYTNQNASYKFAVFSKDEIEQNDLFEILFPQGTFIPRFMSADKVSMNGIQCMLKPRTVPDENKVQLYVPEVMPAGSIMVEFTRDSGLINPEIAGDYTLSYRSQTASEYLISDPYSITRWHQMAKFILTNLDLYLDSIGIEDVQPSLVNEPVHIKVQISQRADNAFCFHRPEIQS